MHKNLTVEEVSNKLKNIVCDKYQWPEIPEQGYVIEFVLHPDGSLILDFLNEDKGMFWSEASDVVMELPTKGNGEALTWEDLKLAGIPFMS